MTAERAGVCFPLDALLGSLFSHPEAIRAGQPPTSASIIMLSSAASSHTSSSRPSSPNPKLE